MNINTLTPSAKMLKKMQNFNAGRPVTSGDVPVIAIINTCDVIQSKALVDSVSFSIRKLEANPFVQNIPQSGFANKINPMTAKFAESFMNHSAVMAEAIIKTNMADGIVIISECDVTTCGLLLGALKVNCPAVVLPLGVAPKNETLKVAGQIQKGQFTIKKGDEVLQKADGLFGQTDNFNSVSTFFMLLEGLGFSIEGASLNKRGVGAQLKIAEQLGEKIVDMAKKILSPRKLVTKITFADAIALCLKIGGDIGAIELIKKLAIAADVKVTHEVVAEAAAKTALIIASENQKCSYIRENSGIAAVVGNVSEAVSKSARVVLCKGSACDKGGYVQYSEETVATFSGKAWVYQNLEDADVALLGGNIPSGSVIVVLNCVGVNVSALAYAIEGMGRASEFAIATDGLCDKTSVLAVTLCSPTSLENEEFANIQNGDVLDIDITRGRFNTSILAKDQKVRMKKNTVKKLTMHF